MIAQLSEKKKAKEQKKKDNEEQKKKDAKRLRDAQYRREKRNAEYAKENRNVKGNEAVRMCSYVDKTGKKCQRHSKTTQGYTGRRWWMERK